MKIILLASEGRSTNILYNKINSQFEISEVVIEKSISANVFWKTRLKKLGFWKVLDQILFIIVIQRTLRILSKPRESRILIDNDLSAASIPAGKITRVDSINDEKVILLINEMKPDLVLVNGTRIISGKILKSTKASFINIHAGITPEYRGVHGAYWAFYNKEPEMAGVTLHFVDKGVDTGNIISQQKISITKEDNFVTYPLLQLSVGLNLLSDYLKCLVASQPYISNTLSAGRSMQWYHPGFFQYIFYRIKYKIK